MEDTEGPAIEKPLYEPSALPPLHEVAINYGVKVQYGPMTKRFYGYYRPITNEIMLCTHDIDVFFHELAHAIHDTIRPLKGGQDSDQEIVAETVSAVLCQLYGYKGYLYQGYQYIARYAKESTPAGVIKSIMKVLSDVQKVLEIILTTANENQVAA